MSFAPIPLPAFLGITVCAWLGVSSPLTAATTASSEWVRPGPNGRLVYKHTAAGDRITDFSHAGYGGGGVALPEVDVHETVHPSDRGDDTAIIQAAIDRVSALPLRNGFRGAVLLAPGTFTCSQPLTIFADGVVLRGSGSGAGENVIGRSTIRMSGAPHLAVAVRAPRDGTHAPAADAPSFSTMITDDLVPSGASSFTVRDASGFAIGDVVAIERPVTEEWIRFMQMADLTRDGRPQTWLRAGTVTSMERRVVALAGSRVTVDAPLTDSFNARLLGPTGTTVVKRPPPPHVARVGIEYLHIESPLQEISHHEPHFTAVRIDGRDCWMRDVVIDETMNSVATSGRRITLERVTIRRKARHQGASRPMEFAPNASDVLLDRCVVIGDNLWFVGTGAMVTGPIVILNCTFVGDGRAESHQRWSTAILYDNCVVPNGGIEMRNRGSMGSGHGWTMGWGVVWNCTADSYLVQNPPGVMNWVIGSIGKNSASARPFGQGPTLPGGVVDSPGVPVEPRSLYLAQLAERLGPTALANIGYASAAPASAMRVNAAGTTQLPTILRDDHTGNLARNRPVLATNVRAGSRDFAAWRATDDDDQTAWATDDGVAEARLELDTEGAVVINRLELGEASDAEGRVQSWRLEGFTSDAWQVLAEGGTIGARSVVRFPEISLWKIRLTIHISGGHAAIRHVGAYRDE